MFGCMWRRLVIRSRRVLCRDLDISVVRANSIYLPNVFRLPTCTGGGSSRRHQNGALGMISLCRYVISGEHVFLCNMSVSTATTKLTQTPNTTQALCKEPFYHQISN